VIYVVGWTAPDEIPADIIDTIFMLVGDRDELREDTVMGVGYAVQRLPAGAEYILAPHRRYWHAPLACVA
jgi:hypothetical protein